MRIIITADDFGYSDDSVDATIDCFEKGGITGASIMANMPATERALEYARLHPEYSYGVHLTFVGEGAERPLTEPNGLPALVDGEGCFVAANGLRLRALLGTVPQDQIEREMRAQLAFVADHGVAVSYVDSHKHLHKFAPFRAVLARVLPDFGICKVRNVQDVFLRKPLTSTTFWLGAHWRKRIMKLFDTTEHFYMPTSTGDREWHDALLDGITGGTVEVAGHPGFREDWRAEEKRDLCRFAEHARNNGHELISWRDPLQGSHPVRLGQTE